MELHEAVKNRRTYQNFTNQKINKIIIEKALEASNFAPCHKLTFPWRYTIVSIEKRKELADIANKIKNKRNDEIERNKTIRKYINPSDLIVASQVISQDPLRQQEDYAACCCSIQNLLLSLASDNVGSKWATGRNTISLDTYKSLNIDPNIERIIGFIWAGYGVPPSPVKRPLVSSVIRSI